MRFEKRFEIDLGRMQGHGGTRHDDLLDLVIGFGEGRGERGQQRTRYQHELCARVLEHVRIVVGGEQRVDRHRHHARVHRTQETDGPVVAVVHQQQHPLFATQPQGTQPGGHSPDTALEFAVAERSLIVNERGLVGSTGIAIDQVLGEVEALTRSADIGFRV